MQHREAVPGERAGGRAPSLARDGCASSRSWRIVALLRSIQAAGGRRRRAPGTPSQPWVTEHALPDRSINETLAPADLGRRIRRDPATGPLAGACAAVKLRASAFALWIIASGTAFGAGEVDIGSTAAASIPPHVVTAFARFPSSDDYAFSAHINPFYVQGDFNGDGKLDTAILIKHKATGKAGFAVVHGGSDTVRVVGAGRSFGNGGDDFSWQDAWYTYAKGTVGPGAGEGAPPRLAGDAIMVIKTDSASAFVYWAGNRYRWYQQGD